MIGFKVTVRDETQRVQAKARQASIESLGHAGAAVRLTARRSIRRRKKPSPPGRPPHTRRGQLRRSIAYALEKQRQRAVVGPQAALVGTSGKAHEFGGRYRRERYPRRSFMGPALEAITPRLPRFWRASVR